MIVRCLLALIYFVLGLATFLLAKPLPARNADDVEHDLALYDAHRAALPAAWCSFGIAVASALQFVWEIFMAVPYR